MITLRRWKLRPAVRPELRRAAWSGAAAGLVVLLTTCLCGAALYLQSVRALKAEVRAGLIRTATIAAVMVDGEVHKTFISPKQETTPAYFRAIKPLAQVQKASGDIKYIYTCVLSQGQVYFILDPTPPGDQNSDGVDDKSHIMQLYPDATPAMLSALRTGQAQADMEPTHDEWGDEISGYAPFYDSHKHFVGIVGVDLSANHYVARLAAMHRAAVTGFSLGAVLAVLASLAMFFAQVRALKAARLLKAAHREMESRVAARTFELAEANLHLNQAYEATIEGWSRALDLRDHETQGHSRRVMEMTVRLAHTMGLSGGQLIQIQRGSLLHDIGKMAVPDSILLKPGPLTDEERAIMCRHPEHALEMLWLIEFLRPALEIPYCHHEKWDGTGYPQGLVGEGIPLAARLFAIVDVWDALSSDRPYRKAWPHARVMDHLHSLAGTHFDPSVVEAFLKLIDSQEIPEIEATGPMLTGLAA